MFKKKFTLLDTSWNQLYIYKSSVKPSEGEYIYIDDHKSYYKVLRVVHSIKKPKQTILVVELIKNFSEK
jgi:hypothetical protein